MITWEHVYVKNMLLGKNIEATAINAAQPVS